MRKIVMSLITVVMIVMVVACSSEGTNKVGEAPETQNKPPEPVTLTFVSSLISKSQFDKEIAAPIRARFDHITLEFHSISQGDLAKWVAEDRIPDIIHDIDKAHIPVQHLDLLQSDLQNLVNKYQVNLRALDTDLLGRIQAYSSKGELLALPYTRTLYAMFYNQELFDNQLVSYPSDGMTWDQVLELAKKMSYRANGTKYRGLEPFASGLGPAMFFDQFGLHLIDSKSSKADVLNQGWRDMSTLLRSIYQMPGNEPDLTRSLGTTEFARDGTVAMAMGEGFDLLVRSVGAGKKVDLVSYPVLRDVPGMGPGSRAEILVIPSGSEHKDEAFQVIAALISPEIQQAKSLAGRGTVLNDREIMMTYGADLPEAKGKNIQAFFGNRPRTIPDLHRYEPTIYLESIGYFLEIAGFTGLEVDAALTRFEQFVNQSISQLDETLNVKAKE